MTGLMDVAHWNHQIPKKLPQIHTHLWADESHKLWSAGTDAALTPEAQLRLDGLQDKLHDLQQQDAAEAAAAESGQTLGGEAPGGEGEASEEPLAAEATTEVVRKGSGGEDPIEGDGADRAAGSDAGQSNRVLIPCLVCQTSFQLSASCDCFQIHHGSFREALCSEMHASAPSVVFRR